MKEIIQVLMDKVFNEKYPNKWNNQLLNPIPKNGHTLLAPKLRGVAIGVLFSRLYDDIINGRFCNWYEPNPEQGGYRKEQGCVLILFGLLMMIHYARCTGKELFVGLLDFEKAFDYANRDMLLNKLIGDGIGSKFAGALKNMYLQTKYVPKISNTRIGDEITSDFGVTQGRKSSANLFSYYLSDMGVDLSKVETDFMDPYSLLQLADDANLLAESLESLTIKFTIIFAYAILKCQHVNAKKTKYMHMSDEPIMDTITLESGEEIDPVDPKEGSIFLGFFLSYSNNIYAIIDKNISHKMYNIIKFYAWLECNEETPFFIKIKTLYTCLFASIFYSIEAWGDISQYGERILNIEKEALKRCLGVKGSTMNDLVYLELQRADMVAHVKDRQHKFYNKIVKLTTDESVVKSIWNLCKSIEVTSSFTSYYESLQKDNKSIDISNRKAKVIDSGQSMCKRYTTIVGTNYCHVLYQSALQDSKRKIITRWRLSCHPLRIEKGRYTKPKTPREDRKCLICDEVDDEKHALFVCKAHRIIREQHRDILVTCDDVTKLLNPTTILDATRTACYLQAVEDNMKELGIV